MSQYHVAVAARTELDNQARLLRQAREADAADHLLTVRQALSKYRKAVAWAMFLSLTLVMEGFDLQMFSGLYAQTQFRERFGSWDPITSSYVIEPAWQTGISNAAVVGQIFGLAINGWAQDKFGCRPTMLFFLAYLNAALFALVFAPNLAVLCVGAVLCGLAWGVFQTLSTAYACEVVPIALRPYVTSWVCACWGLGQLIGAGVLRAALEIDSQWGWRLPLTLQYVWPLPLMVGVFFAPESPWNSVRRERYDLALNSLRRLRQPSPSREDDIEASLALIKHTTALERAETAGATFLQCFQGINLRRTEINCVVWAAQILCGNGILGFAVLFLQRAGFSERNSFNINISLAACYLVGWVISMFLLFRFGRSTIYMGGLLGMLICLLVIGGMGFSTSSSVATAVAIMFVISTLINMITVGPICYCIVSETPSGPLRYKTISIGRVVYNCTGIVNNILTPRMVQENAWNWGAKTALFFAGTNLLCLAWCWFRLPETKDRSFGEIEILFANKVSARKFKTTKVDQFANEDDGAADKPEIEHRDKV